MANNRVSAVSSGQQSIDVGLRSYMQKVYNYMTGGLLVTALTVYLLLNTYLINLFITVNEGMLSLTVLGWISLIAPLVVIFLFQNAVYSKSLATVQTIFWIYSALMGLSLAPIMILYTGESIARVFLITASTFGIMSIYGYTTKRDLSTLGSFLMMGLLGIIIASIVNIFWASTSLYFAISVLAVLIFVGLTAYDTQKITQMYRQDEEESSRIAIAGALNLYLDFINLFLYLLRFLGNRK